MTKENLKNLITRYQALDQMCDELSKLGALEVSGAFYEAIFHAFEAALECADETGDIAWYIYENACGAKELRAGYDKKFKKIKNVDDLWKLIKQGK